MSEVDAASNQLFHTFLCDTAVGQVDVFQFLTPIAALQVQGREERERERERKREREERGRRDKGDKE